MLFTSARNIATTPGDIKDTFMRLMVLHEAELSRRDILKMFGVAISQAAAPIRMAGLVSKALPAMADPVRVVMDVGVPHPRSGPGIHTWAKKIENGFAVAKLLLGKQVVGFPDEEGHDYEFGTVLPLDRALRLTAKLVRPDDAKRVADLVRRGELEDLSFRGPSGVEFYLSRKPRPVLTPAKGGWANVPLKALVSGKRFAQNPVTEWWKQIGHIPWSWSQLTSRETANTITKYGLHKITPDRVTRKMLVHSLKTNNMISPADLRKYDVKLTPADLEHAEKYAVDRHELEAMGLSDELPPEEPKPEPKPEEKPKDWEEILAAGELYGIKDDLENRLRVALSG